MTLDFIEMFGIRPRHRRKLDAALPGGVWGPEPFDTLDADGQATTTWQHGMVSVSFDVAPTVAALFRDALHRAGEVTGGVLNHGQVVTWMLAQFAKAHAGPEVVRCVKEFELFARTGWTCTMPGCRSMSGLHLHHVVWRSRGGSDDASNLTPPCARCHRLVHDGFVVVHGAAPDALTFVIGRGSRKEVYVNDMRVVVAA